MEIASIDRAHMSSYQRSIVATYMSISCTVSEIYEILVENRRFNLPHLYFGPQLGVIPLEFRQKCIRKLDSLGYRMAWFAWLICLAVLVQCRLVTDRQMDRHSTTAYTAPALRRVVTDLFPSKIRGARRVGPPPTWISACKLIINLNK